MHSLSIWTGAHDDQAPLLVLFGGQLTSNIVIPDFPSPSTAPAQQVDQFDSLHLSGPGGHSQHKDQGGGIDFHMLDDDSSWSWSDATAHAQANDIWIYNPSRDVWHLASIGGCHKGDDGRLERKHVDLSALLAVGILLSACLFGAFSYNFLRRNNYMPIPEVDILVS